MNEFERLLAFMKISYQSLGTLHRHLSGSPAWFSVHSELADWYEKLSEQLDDLIEVGLALSYRDPSIKDAVLMFGGDLAESAPVSCEQALRRAMEIFRSVSGMMGAARPIVPINVQAKLDEYGYDWDKIANYMIAHALGEGAGGIVIDDD